MRMLAVLALLAALGLVLNHFRPSPPTGEPPAFRFEGLTMGTYYKVTLAGAEVSREESPRLQAAVEEELDRVNAAMSTYLPDSEISRFNLARHTDPIPVGPEFRRVLERSFELSEELSGYFDPTVGPLVVAWGFGPGERSGSVPSEEDLGTLRARVGMDKLELGEAGLRKLHPEVEIDLSGIAKGYAVDRVVARMVAEGYLNVFVDIGGDVAVHGRNPWGQSWRVGVQVPDPESGFSAKRVVGLDHGGMATSGDYRNFRETDEGRAHHILDPTTGRPVETSLTSVSVLATDCMTADAIATGLFVMGVERGMQWVEGRPGVEALFIWRGEDGFESRATPGFEQRFLD